MNHSNGGTRASLLSGLRTGGVRSASGPIMPHTAAPGGSFHIPHRFASGAHSAPVYEDPDDYGQTLQYSAPVGYGVPMTAGLAENRNPRFQQPQSALTHQQMMMRQAQLASMGGMPGMGGMSHMNINPMDAQLQLQMMQAMAYQQQNIQTQIALQQQAALKLAQQQSSKPANRVPASAGPAQSSFDLRSNAIAHLRNSRLQNLDEQEHESGPIPMSAALGGKFGSRSMPNGFNKSAAVDYNNPPATPSSTVVISGGVSIGGASTGTPVSAAFAESDSAVSWRRPSVASTAPAAYQAFPRAPSPPKSASPPTPSPPRVTISTPEETERMTPILNAAPAPPKARPGTLGYASRGQSGLPALAQDGDGYDSEKSNSSNPGSSVDVPKRYEGVGIGRPRASSVAVPAEVRVSQAVRQPRGPPAGVEDFGSLNFASRVKRVQVVVPATVEAY